MKNYNNKIKIDFSLKREVFFVVVGAIIGVSFLLFLKQSLMWQWECLITCHG